MSLRANPARLFARHALSPLGFLACAFLASGCAGAQIEGISAPEPDEPVVIVTALADGLSHVPERCHVVVRYGPYQGVSNVPLTGVSNPERVDVRIDSWHRLTPPASSQQMEVWFTYPTPRHPIHKASFAAPFDVQLIKDEIARNRAVPRSRRRRGRRARSKEPVRTRETPSTPLPADGPPRGWGEPSDLSTDVDRPSSGGVEDPIVVKLGAKEGTRYFKIDNPPKGLVRLVIDVKSLGDPQAVNEATWFRIALLDEAGMATPLDLQEFVGVGQEKRHVTTWRFDGSPCILKLASGSKSGDWLRLRLETQ